MIARCTWLVFLAAVLTGCETRVEMAPQQPERAPERAAPRPQQRESASRDRGEPAEGMARLEQEIHRGVNTQRTEAGLQPLAVDPELTRLARDYSRRMARESFFSHTAPNGDTFEDRVQRANLRYSIVGENLFKTVNVPLGRFPRVAVQGWLDSPGHRKNMLRDGFTETGIGVWKSGATIYATQLFSHPR